jgi:hypothetical protein
VRWRFSLAVTDEIRDDRLQTQESFGRAEALEPPREHATSLDLLVAALDWVIVMAQAEALAGYGHTVHEPCYSIKPAVERFTNRP